jgi:hypothetical protein
MFVQSLAAFLAIPVDMPQAGSGSMNPVLPIYRPYRYFQYPRHLAPIPIELCYVPPVSRGIDGSHKPVWS